MLQSIIAFTLLGSVGAILGAGLLLAFPKGIRQLLLPFLVSFAVGTLLGSAFLCLIPTGLEKAAPLPFMATLLGGLVGFFALEKLILLRHSLAHENGGQGSPGALILVGDAFHNFVDGVVIAAAFMTSAPLGITVALAVIAHEIPQEVGEFAILLDSGFSKGKAFLLNLISATAALQGALVACFWLGQAEAAVPYMLALSAASFVYVAAVDLIPTLHRDMSRRASFQQLLLLVGGISTIAVITFA